METRGTYPWMQCLDAAIHHFGELCVLRYVLHWETCFLDRPRRDAGGQQMHIVLGQNTRQFDQPSLFCNNQMRA